MPTTRVQYLTPFAVLVLPFFVPASAFSAWPPDPNIGNVGICTAAIHQLNPTVAADGAGGAIVAWQDARTGSNDVYVQRVNAVGAPQWTANGVALCTTPGPSVVPTIVSDGAGGAIITWQDARIGNYDIYVQRVNAAGSPQWIADGVLLCGAGGDQHAPTIVSDGAGGAIVTWHDRRSPSNDIYAQRVNAAGAPLWIPDGVLLCGAGGDQLSPTIASDGGGGAIVTWYDNRSANTDI